MLTARKTFHVDFYDVNQYILCVTTWPYWYRQMINRLTLLASNNVNTYPYKWHHTVMMSTLSLKYDCRLKSLLQQGILTPMFYGDLINKKKIKNNINCYTLFIKTYLKGRLLFACLVIYLSTIDRYAYHFICTTVTGVWELINGSSISSFYLCHRILAYLTPCALVSGFPKKRH